MRFLTANKGSQKNNIWVLCFSHSLNLRWYIIICNTQDCYFIKYNFNVFFPPNITTTYCPRYRLYSIYDKLLLLCTKYILFVFNYQSAIKRIFEQVLIRVLHVGGFYFVFNLFVTYK